MKIRHCTAAVAALLALGSSALAVDYEAGNPVGHEGQAEIGVVSPVRYEGGVVIGHDRSDSLLVVTDVPYDDPAYTFDDAIGSTAAPGSDGARDSATGPSRRAAR